MDNNNNNNNNNNKIQSIITNLENENKDLIDKGYVLTGIITFDVNKKQEETIGGGKKKNTSTNVNFRDAPTSQGSVQVEDTNSRRDFTNQSERIESLGIHGNFVRLAANDPDIATILTVLHQITNLTTLASSLQNLFPSTVDGSPLLHVRAYHGNVSTGYEAGIGFWELDPGPNAGNNFHTQFVHLSIHVPQGTPININPTVVRDTGSIGRPPLARNIQDGIWDRRNTRMRNLGAVHIRGSNRNTSRVQPVSNYDSSRRAISFEFAWTIDAEGIYYLQIYNYITTAGGNDNLIIRNIDAIIRVLNQSLRQSSQLVRNTGPRNKKSVKEPSTFYPRSPPPPSSGPSSGGPSSGASPIATGGKIKKKKTKKTKKTRKIRKSKKNKNSKKAKKTMKNKKQRKIKNKK